MRAIVEKLMDIERQVAEEKGPFSLFALFLREDAPNVWDLVVSAEWVSDKYVTMGYIAEKVSKSLSSEEIIKISRIVVLDQNNPGLEAVLRAIQIEHGAAEVLGSNFFGLDIKHAYIITSRRNVSPPVDGGAPPTPDSAVLRG